MITHTIVRYKPRVKSFETYPPVINESNKNLPITSRLEQVFFMGKYEYAQMLKRLKLVKGDTCFFKGTTIPVEDKDIFKVVDINEIFYLDRSNRIDVKQPRPYLLRNKAGDERYACDDDLIKLVDGDD